MSAHQDAVLYSFRRCPYAIRARMGLQAADFNPHVREVVLRDKPQELTDVSPKATVPVLTLGDGTIIDESLDILLFALRQNDPLGLLDAYDEKAQALIAANDTGFKQALNRYKYPSRFPDEDCSDAQGNCRAFFERINDVLIQSDYLNGDVLSVSDLATFPFIRQCAHVDKEWFGALPLPALHRWFHVMRDGDLFLSVMPKLDQWENSDAVIRFQDIMIAS